jgi:hypothetical protein
VLVLATGLVVLVARLVGDGHGSSVDTSRWIHVVDRATGFADRLPVNPRDVTLPAADIGGGHASYHLALVGARDGAGLGSKEGPPIAVECGEITPGIPAEAYTPNLRGAIFGFVAASGFDLVSQQGGSFHGHPAWRGTFRGPRSEYQAVAFMQSSSRMYMIVTTARLFEAVTANFHVIALARPRDPTSSA